MRRSLITLCAFIFALGLIVVADADMANAIPRNGETGSATASSGGSKSDSKKDDKRKDFSEVVKEFTKFPGMLDLYCKEDEGKMYIALRPDQLEVIYLMGLSRVKGDGSFYDSGSMGGEFPFYFKKQEDKVLLMMDNYLVQADKESPINRAVEEGVGDAAFASGKIVEAKPGPKDEILIDASDFFLQDPYNVGYFLGQRGQTGFSMDKSNSRFAVCKSFEKNTEIQVTLHFATSRPAPGSDFAISPYSMFLTYQYSISALPPDGFTSRPADVRVGNFYTIFEDYTNHDEEIDEATVRNIYRWRLEKEEPYAELSKPKQPIVYWLDNNIPLEYRKAVADGVLYWNKCFEKIGFKDAIVVKQRPDDADWDPADVRYATITWMVMPGAGYAVGPSRANPYTGEIYDADIRVSSDWLRWMWSYWVNQTDPVAFNSEMLTRDLIIDETDEHNHSFEGGFTPKHMRNMCNFGSELAQQGAAAYAVLEARDAFEGKSEEAKRFVYEYLVNVVAHEVGHTLGFAHNFTSTTFQTAAELTDRESSLAKGQTGTCMDYAPANIAPPGQKQGQYFQTTPGPYDYWVVEYAYKPLDATTAESQKAELEKIAERSREKGLAYGTDNDAISVYSTQAYDPLCNYFDMGADPIQYYRDRTALSRELWSKVEQKFSIDGLPYNKMRRVFSTGWRGYREAGLNVSKYVGGYYQSRALIGDPNSGDPLTPVPAGKQREAMDFIVGTILAADAFNFSPSLLTKLEPQRTWDLRTNIFNYPDVIYPIHDMVLSTQIFPLVKLYSSAQMTRLHDQQLRAKDPYTLDEMFTTLRRGIWTELQGGTNINSFRRNLQTEHLNILATILKDTSGAFPEDARSLALNDMNVIDSAISGILRNGSVNEMTKAHLARVADQIRAIKESTEARG